MLQPQRLADIDRDAFIHRKASVDPAIRQRALEIIEVVQDDGLSALIGFTQKYDGIELEDPFLADADWTRLADECPADVQTAIDENLGRIRRFHALQVGQEVVLEVEPGLTLGRRPVPYQAVACYVPGGRASYPSTVLMTVAPAVLAGVPEILVVTPPGLDGMIDPAVAYAAKAAGATRILRAGGAQAIAAVAYGAGPVPAVDAIVGPGNAYVTAAKELVNDDVWADAPAGPSELLVLADGDAPPDCIVWDLVAQAEHDPEAQCLLVTDDPALAAAVADRLRDLVPETARREIIEASLQEHGALLVADSWDDAIDFTNAYAPEHLEIMSRQSDVDLDRIRNAGSIFVGPDTPVPLGDYGSGTNHVLPTMGIARFRGGLSVDDFRKWITWQEATPDGLARVGPAVARLARAEGLIGHAEAVERRLR